MAALRDARRIVENAAVAERADAGQDADALLPAVAHQLLELFDAVVVRADCPPDHDAVDVMRRGVIDDSDAAWCVSAHPEMGFNKAKHSYFPIPFDEKKVNPNIHDWNAQ